MKTSKSKKRATKELTGQAFDALPAADKERIYHELDRKTPEQLEAESRPLNARERAEWREIRKKMGRPKIGKGAQVISLSIERSLLKRIDAYAKANGMGRSEVFVSVVSERIGA